MKNDSSRILSYRYPEILKNNKYFGDLTQSSIVNISGETVINYGFSSALYDSTGNIIERWKGNIDNKEIVAPPITSQDYLDLYRYSQHFDSYHFGSLIVDPRSMLCIKPLYIAKFEGSRDLLPAITKTEIRCYDFRSWSLVTKIVIERRLYPYIYNNKILYCGDLIQTDKYDYFEIFQVRW